MYPPMSRHPPSGECFRRHGLGRAPLSTTHLSLLVVAITDGAGKVREHGVVIRLGYSCARANQNAPTSSRGLSRFLQRGRARLSSSSARRRRNDYEDAVLVEQLLKERGDLSRLQGQRPSARGSRLRSSISRMTTRSSTVRGMVNCSR